MKILSQYPRRSKIKGDKPMVLFCLGMIFLNITIPFFPSPCIYEQSHILARGDID